LENIFFVIFIATYGIVLRYVFTRPASATGWIEALSFNACNCNHGMKNNHVPHIPTKNGKIGKSSSARER
jgi:hypothetical protein